MSTSRKQIISEVEISRMLDRVEVHLENGEFRKALRECEAVIQMDPHFADAHNLRGEIHEEMEQLENAIASYRKAIELEPEFEEAWENMLGVELALEEEFEDSVARRHLDQALEYANNEETEKALAECKAAKPHLPGIAVAYNYMGLILQTINQLEPAIDAYIKAIQLNPRFYAARENLASARISWEEEQYRLFSALPPVETHQLMKPDMNQVSRSDENLPQWLYMNEKGFFFKGYPGHRTRLGRSGYDPVDRNAEWGRMQGIMIRQLLARKFRTRNPIYLAGMTLAGIIYLLPALLSLILPGPGRILLAIIYGPYFVLGAALLLNVYLSFRLDHSTEHDDNGFTFF